MSVTLYLDSSNTSLSVGFANKEILFETSYEAWQSQSEHMIPEIDNLMKEHGISREDIDGIVVAVGPGSYTGVRIAITIAKVMGLALNVPVYSISSLHCLKDNDNPSICLINARSGRSYFGVFQNEKVIINDCIMKNDEVINYINSHPEYSVCGDLAYLSLQGIKRDIVKQMSSIKEFLNPVENPLGLTPVYMKD